MRNYNRVVEDKIKQKLQAEGALLTGMSFTRQDGVNKILLASLGK